MAGFSALANLSALLIVPQGALTSLPFEALIDAETDRFLVEDLEVSYVPSATMAARLLDAPSSNARRVAAVFDSLVDINTQEIASLEQAREIDVEKLSTRNATAEQVIEFLGSAPFVHVLLHGIFAEDDPLQSFVELENPRLSAADRRITAAELLAADWHATELAVFSACEGGRVTARISNEIHGLSWAPLVGGAERVLVSRWRVNAASNGRWMAVLYDALKQGNSAAGAVAQAMRQLMKGDTAHPYYWAGPQLYGR